MGGGSGLATLIATRQEIAAFQVAVAALASQPKRVTLPRPRGQKEYEIVSFEDINGAWRGATERHIVRERAAVIEQELTLLCEPVSVRYRTGLRTSCH